MVDNLAFVFTKSYVTFKLETWLRMNKIKYEDVYSMVLGSKGQTPYVELNGEELTDSNLIMEKLGRQFGDCDDGVLGGVHFARIPDYT